MRKGLGNWQARTKIEPTIDSDISLGVLRLFYLFLFQSQVVWAALLSELLVRAKEALSRAHFGHRIDSGCNGA